MSAPLLSSVDVGVAAKGRSTGSTTSEGSFVTRFAEVQPERDAIQPERENQLEDEAVDDAPLERSVHQNRGGGHQDQAHGHHYTEAERNDSRGSSFVYSAGNKTSPASLVKQKLRAEAEQPSEDGTTSFFAAVRREEADASSSDEEGASIGAPSSSEATHSETLKSRDSSLGKSSVPRGTEDFPHSQPPPHSAVPRTFSATILAQEQRVLDEPSDELVPEPRSPAKLIDRDVILNMVVTGGDGRWTAGSTDWGWARDVCRSIVVAAMFLFVGAVAMVGGCDFPQGGWTDGDDV